MFSVHAGGCLMERTLAAGETLRIDTGCIVGFSRPSVRYPSTLARSKRRSSVEKGCFLPPFGDPVESGCNRSR